MKQSQHVVFKVKSSIQGHGVGWCFTPSDFLSIGHNTTIRQILLRLEKVGFIRRVSWGLYEYPRKHQKLGLLPPDIQQVVKAITRKDNINVLPSGAMAANLLGISNQVPAKIIYLTEGVSKRIQIGKQEIIFKKTTPKNMATANTFAGIAIQGLKYLGIKNVDSSVLTKLRNRLSKDEIYSLKKYGRYAPVWIQKIFQLLIEGTRNG
jgi:hypothetical protein